MPRYALTLAYDGTDFRGWQKQEPLAPEASLGAMELARHTREGESAPRVELRTVAAVVERAVREIVREPVEVKGASRTDAGVHAKGQTAAFTCSDGSGPGAGERGHGGWPVERGVDRLIRAINGRLPNDVLVLAARVVPDDFDPISHAVAKGYRYSIHASPTRALWDRRYVHQVWEPLDVPAMNEAACALVGTHDFAGFAAAGHGRKTTIRTIHECRVRAVVGRHSVPTLDEGTCRLGEPTHQERRVEIDVSGNGFLYNMVRIIAGTLVDVGRGRIAAGDIPEILASRDRTRAGPTLPPEGLRLEWIRYPHDAPA